MSEAVVLLKQLVSYIEDCDDCEGTGKTRHVPSDACRNCGGFGEVLRASAIECATEAREYLERA